MSTLLEKALAKVGARPEDEQDAITSQILASLEDEAAWKRRFAEKRDVIRRMAQEALDEDARGETRNMDSIQETINLYKRDIDVTLLEENLRKTPEERIRALDDFEASREELRAAAERRRRNSVR
jgi:hypothetical protein